MSDPTENDLLEAAIVHRDQIIRDLEDQVRQLKTDLAMSDDIRGALIGSTRDVAKDMLRALELTEAAFHAGVQLGKSGDVHKFDSIDHAFRAWSKEALKKG